MHGGAGNGGILSDPRASLLQGFDLVAVARDWLAFCDWCLGLELEPQRQVPSPSPTPGRAVNGHLYRMFRRGPQKARRQASAEHSARRSVGQTCDEMPSPGRQ